MNSNEIIILNPLEKIYSSDPVARRLAVSVLAQNAKGEHKELFEDLLFDNDVFVSFISYLALKKLFPLSETINKAWYEIFSESIEILVQRAVSSPLPIKLAALQTLAFAPESVSSNLIEKIHSGVYEISNLSDLYWREPPTIPLIQERKLLELSEGFALLLSTLPLGYERFDFLKKELQKNDINRVLPVLISLQINPLSELTDAIIPWLRFHDIRTSIEACRALFSCSGKKAYIILSSILKETTEPYKKAAIINLLANINKPEIWNTIVQHLRHSSPIVRRAAVGAISTFPEMKNEKANLLLPLLKDKDVTVRCEVAKALWNLGLLEGLKYLENLFIKGTSFERSLVAYTLAEFPPETSIPILIEAFGKEKQGDVIRQIILSLRTLLSKIAPSSDLCDKLLPILKRHINSTDPFIRSQTAVLAGYLSYAAEDLLLSALEKPQHPHVIASIISSLGKIGYSRVLVLAKFQDHPDPRVRSNLMNSIASAGTAAIPYLTAALQDPAPRVASTAAYNLFLLGQTEVIGILNRMMLVQSQASVLAGIYGISKLLRHYPGILKSDHPIKLTLLRQARKKEQDSTIQLPEIIKAEEFYKLFEELSIAKGDPEKLEWIIQAYQNTYPNNLGIKRLLASIQIIQNKFKEALHNLEICINENPAILVDLLDCYKLSIKIGDLIRAEIYGQRINGIYQRILSACYEITSQIKGKGSEKILEKLHSLKEPSLNIYAVMIQLKALQEDKETALELLWELFLARPLNTVLGYKLLGLLPESFSKLAHSLEIYLSSLPIVYNHNKS